MKFTQNQLEHLKDMMEQGNMTADQANVEKVRMARVQIVTSKIPQQVRKALNAAVKIGYLGHYPKSGNKPEAYFHPTFDYLAKGERARHERETLAALLRVCC